MFLETDSLSIGESQELVVVHDRVHVLHPQGIHVSVKQNVLPLVLLRRSVDLSEDVGEETVRPVSSHGVQDPVQLYHRHCLGVYGVQLGAQTQPATWSKHMYTHE